MPGANVAIIGVGCRLGGARSADELLARLDAAPEPFAPLPAERWDPRAFGEPPHARLIDDYDVDFRVFRIPPAQLAQMHRMERAALAAMRDALVDAGLEQPGAWSERTAVHMAATTLGFDPAVDHLARVRLHETQSALRAAAGDGVPASAVDAALRALDEMAPPISVDSLMTTAAMTAGRLANAFDLGGGHCSHDAGAASALAALAAAVASLEAHECDVAVVGALSPLLAATVVQAYDKRRLLARADRVEAGGGGTLLGEAAVALVLMREGEARPQARRIRAVIRAVATASLGRRGVSTGAESMMVRAARQALGAAHFAAGSIDHVECQGSGLGVVGEAEARALGAVYGDGARTAALSLRSCVPTFGFTGAASGLVGVAAAALTLERGPARRGAVNAPGLGAVVYHVVLARADDRAARVSSTRVAPSSDRRVAIVGVGAVIPGASNAAELWRGINDGLDAITQIPVARWDAERFLDTATRGVSGAVRSTIAGLLPEVQADAARLRLPPVAARRVDRAVVLAVDACAAALEDAGYRAGSWDPKRVGVIVGHLPLRDAEFQAERQALAARARAVVERVLGEAGVAADEIERVRGELYATLTRDLPPPSEETLENLSSLQCATRVATLYDFRGGAEAVDGACASSLVALHLGVGALVRGELDAVVVGAAAYNLFPEYYVALATLGALSGSASRPFDADADGFVPAEGAGAVVLRRVSDAARDRNRVYAVVIGSACSSDGRGTALLAPSSRGQQRALERAYRVAQVTPASIDLLEAHGTGTRAGDAVEVETYGAIFAERDRSRPIALGSIKSNVGHLSSAAGMAGLIKTALALHHRVLPPMRHSGQLHADHRALVDGPLAVASKTRPWPSPPDGAPRRAAVSAFGLGGINAHVVLEEQVAAERRSARPAPPAEEATPRRAQRLRIELVPVSLPAVARSRPSGTLLLLGNPAGAVAAAVGDALEQAGWQLLRWNPPSGAPISDIIARIGELDAPGLVGAIDLVELDGSDPLPPADAALDATRRAVATSRALWPRWEQLDGGGVYFALTAMGGSLGLLSGQRVGAGGALAGFVKGLKQERPALLARVVDFDGDEEARFIGDTVVAELGCGGDRLEVGYFTRRRLVPALRLAPLATGRPPLLDIEPGSVVVFSGGARGIVFECARALAERGAVCVVSGRTARPRGDEPWLALDDAGFEELRRAQMLERHRQDPSLTPVRFAAEWEATARARRLHRNLVSAGSAIEYVAADVADAASCAKLLAEVRRRHGRIDGVVHGAMVEQSRALPDKAPEIVDATVRIKVAGLDHLATGTRADPLRFFVAFGSVAGRFGNRGQADYCAANDAMAKLLAREARQRPATRCVTIDWTAWADVGSAAEPRTAALLHQAGVEAIAPAEGRSWFVDEILHGAHADHEVLVCSERQAQRWPFAAHVRDAAGAPPTEIDDRGQPLITADWPLCDTVLSPAADRLVAERSFDGRRDRFFAHHQLDGMPILPGAFAVELMAEAARLLMPGLDVREVRGFAVDKPLKLPAGTSQLVRTEARIVERGARGCVVEVHSAVDLAVGGAIVQRDRRHFRATIVLGAPLPPTRGAGPPPLPVRAVGARQPSRFDSLTVPVALGAIFRNVDWVERAATGAAGEVRAPDEAGLFATTVAPRFSVDPLTLDAAFQVASNWDALAPVGWVAIPLGFAALRVHGRRGAGGAVRVEARVTEEKERDVFYDVVARVGGATLFALERLQLRRIERIDGAGGGA